MRDRGREGDDHEANIVIRSKMAWNRISVSIKFGRPVELWISSNRVHYIMRSLSYKSEFSVLQLWNQERGKFW